MPWDEGVAPGVALGVGSSCIYMYSETKKQPTYPTYLYVSVLGITVR